MRGLFLFIFLAFATEGSARIGWTLQECRKHYGNEVNISKSGITPETVDFRVGNFFVGVSFLNERVAHIYYFKQG
jgi:hypothetical protein